MKSDESAASEAGAGPKKREPGSPTPDDDGPGQPVPWAVSDNPNPFLHGVVSLSRQPTFTGEKELGKRRAGSRFFHRCAVIGFVLSLLPLGLVINDAVRERSGGGGLHSPWLKTGTAVLTLALGGLVLRTRIQVRRPG